MSENAGDSFSQAEFEREWIEWVLSHGHHPDPAKLASYLSCEQGAIPEAIRTYVARLIDPSAHVRRRGPRKDLSECALMDKLRVAEWYKDYYKEAEDRGDKHPHQTALKSLNALLMMPNPRIPKVKGISEKTVERLVTESRKFRAARGLTN